MLLIASTGRCVWDDIAKVKGLDFDVMAVNHMILFYPDDVKYAISWHSDIVGLIVKLRTYRKQKNKPIAIAPKQEEGVDLVGRFHKGSLKTSGMYSVYAALHLGYDKIVLAGMPFDNSGYFYSPGQTHYSFEKKDSPFDTAYENWNTVKEKANDKVRAVSGSLVECFGPLTAEWLKE